MAEVIRGWRWSSDFDTYGIAVDILEALGVPADVPTSTITRALTGYEALRTVYETTWRERNEAEEDAARLAIAIDLTRQYVGADVLPAIAGWSWFDAIEAHNARLRAVGTPVPGDEGATK